MGRIYSPPCFSPPLPSNQIKLSEYFIYDVVRTSPDSPDDGHSGYLAETRVVGSPALRALGTNKLDYKGGHRYVNHGNLLLE